VRTWRHGRQLLSYDNQVTGIAAVEDGVLVFTAKTIFKIEGESQSSFRRYNAGRWTWGKDASLHPAQR
jgi:hypothetical protein